VKLLNLAVRNLLRNRRRSVATLAAVLVGAAAILLFGGYITNIRQSMETAYVRTGGHLQIQHRDFLLYGNGNPQAFAIARHQAIVRGIQSDPELAGALAVVTPTLQFGGLAGNYTAGVSRTIFGLGVVAEDHARMRAWNHYAIPFRETPYRLRGTAGDAALIGEGLARVLQLCAALQVARCPAPTVAPSSTDPLASVTASARSGVDNALPADIAALSETLVEANPGAASAGSTAASAGQGRRLELLVSTPRGTPNVAALDVVAAEGQGFKELDEIFLAIHLDRAQRLVYGAAPPQVTAIHVQLQRPEQVPAVMARLAQQLPQWSQGQALAVLDLPTLNPFFVQTLRLFDTLFGFVFVLIGGIVLFTVSNTMNTAVVERTVEVGTLRAMGTRQSGIRRMFVLEGALLGLAGAVSGAAVALLISGVMNSLDLAWLPPGSAEPLPLVLRVWGQHAMLAFVTLGLIAVATLSAWWPAWRAARLDIVESLRHA
jgi:putative ABC transport system permease protein